MSHYVTTILLLMLAVSALAQQEVSSFQPPQAYEVNRYEAGWNKNPFTLKTAPPVVESESFAKDLAIGTYYGDSANPTIVVVNTKTKERISLRRDQPSTSGISLRSVSLGSSRKDVVAEIILGSETATIRFNDSYVKQMASAEMAKGPATQQSRPQSGAPSKIPGPQPTSPQTRAGTPANPPPATALTSPPPSDRPGYVRPSGTRNAAFNPAAAGTPSSVPLPEPPGANAAPAAPARPKLVLPVFNTMSVSQPSSAPPQ